jgi:hypothetical protein
VKTWTWSFWSVQCRWGRSERDQIFNIQFSTSFHRLTELNIDYRDVRLKPSKR